MWTFGGKYFAPEDFSVNISDINGNWCKIQELNDMIENGVITINREKLNKYKEDKRKNGG